jgi:hypothetical protein
MDANVQGNWSRAKELVTDGLGRFISLVGEASTAQWHGVQTVTRETSKAAANAFTYAGEVSSILTKFQLDLLKAATSGPKKEG